MTRLSDQEKRELLAAAASTLRQDDFHHVEQRLVQLQPGDYLEFQNRTSALSTEKASEPPLMTGDHFLLQVCDGLCTKRADPTT